MIKMVIIKGKEYACTFNGNRELSQPVQGLDDKVLKEWPRERNCSNGVPVIKIDGGTEIRLGFHFFTDAEKAMYKEYKSGLNKGSGTGSGHSAKAKELDAFVREVLALKEASKLSPEALAFAKTCLLEDPKIAKAVKTLMDVGYSEEEARKLVAEKQSK